jgi:hypothetical protein
MRLSSSAPALSLTPSLTSRECGGLDLCAAMPSQEPDRSAEAIRRALPELLKLDRYERRASGRRDQAVRELAKGRT